MVWIISLTYQQCPVIFIRIRIFLIPWNFSLIHNLCVLAPCFTTWQRVLSAAKIFWSSTVIFHSVASMIYKEKHNGYNNWRYIKLIFQIVTGKQHCSPYQLTIHPQTRDLLFNFQFLLQTKCREEEWIGSQKQLLWMALLPVLNCVYWCWLVRS